MFNVSRLQTGRNEVSIEDQSPINLFDKLIQSLNTVEYSDTEKHQKVADDAIILCQTGAEILW